MTVKPLTHIPFNTIITCFLNAFEHYFVKMPVDPDYYKKRWEAAKVNFDLSYGMFDDEKLTGFIIHGIDNRNGRRIAFNTGTGVLPEYRGRKIVKSIYEYALPDLAQKGITASVLEVIKENEVAIKAYKSVGFTICKHYKCFKGKINPENNHPVHLKEIDPKAMDWNSLDNQHTYSWDNHSNSVKEGNYRYFQSWHQEYLESYVIMTPLNGYIAQFDLLKPGEGAWERLFSGIRSISETVRINNVDERLTEKINCLKAIGLENTVDQYEMELRIET